MALVVRRSFAQSVPDSKTLMTVVHADVPFADDGAVADDVAGDGRYAAQLTPATQGFAGRPGTIRLLVELVANGQQGGVAFDLVYLPEVAGAWSGAREALENGALNFYLQAQVRVAGRYVASARVQDANGVPLALLQFNDVVGPGRWSSGFRSRRPGAREESRLPAAPGGRGSLPAEADAFPDRTMMPRLAGVAHVSQRYAMELLHPGVAKRAARSLPGGVPARRHPRGGRTQGSHAAAPLSDAACGDAPGARAVRPEAKAGFDLVRHGTGQGNR